MSEAGAGGQEQYRDESAGEGVLGEPQVARKFLEPPDRLEELLIRTGSVANLPEMMGQMRTMQVGVRYRSPTLTNAPMLWCIATRGAEGEANQMALQAAIGQLDLARGRRNGGGMRRRNGGGDSLAEQGAIVTEVAS